MARAVEALTAILLLGPHIPLMFMGEEWGETRPFSFFTDFHGDLADAVRKGRRAEFRKFAAFADTEQREKIPDPNALATFEASRPDWRLLDDPHHRARHALVSRLLDIRRTEIVPRLYGMTGNAGTAITEDRRALAVHWRLGDGARMSLLANLSDTPALRLSQRRAVCCSRRKQALLKTRPPNRCPVGPWRC